MKTGRHCSVTNEQLQSVGSVTSPAGKRGYRQLVRRRFPGVLRLLGKVLDTQPYDWRRNTGKSTSCFQTRKIQALPLLPDSPLNELLNTCRYRSCLEKPSTSLTPCSKGRERPVPSLGRSWKNLWARRLTESRCLASSQQPCPSS